MMTWDERTRVPKETEDEPTHCATGSLERANLRDRFRTMFTTLLRQFCFPTCDKLATQLATPPQVPWTGNGQKSPRENGKTAGGNLEPVKPRDDRVGRAEDQVPPWFFKAPWRPWHGFEPEKEA